MRKPNYHQAKKQKELSRKARQQEKHQKKVVRTEPEGGSPQAGAPETPPVAGHQAADDPVGSGV
jgi:hypothetical protein